MPDLIPITDPASGRTYRVHPFVGERGEWLAADKTGLRAQLPGMDAFERDVARLTHSQHSSISAPALLGKEHSNDA